MRAEGGGPNHRLPFTDRVIATLVIMRLQLPHAALAVFYQVDRSTLTRAVNEIRPLLADRGLAVPGKPGVRLKTLADVFAYAAAEGVELRIDATEVQVRRPAAHKPGWRAFVSGKRKQNTGKSTVISDSEGRARRHERQRAHLGWDHRPRRALREAPSRVRQPGHLPDRP